MAAEPHAIRPIGRSNMMAPHAAHQIARATALFGLSWSACAEPGESAERYHIVVRDSAGVTVVEWFRAPTGLILAHEASSRPVIAIAPEDIGLTEISAATLVDDSLIAIASESQRSLSIVANNSDGTLRTYRHFAISDSMLQSIDFLWSDTSGHLYLYDARRGHIVWLNDRDSANGFVSLASLAATNIGPLRAVGVVRNGTHLVLRSPVPRDRPGAGLDTGTIAVSMLELHQRRLATVAHIRGQDVFLVPQPHDVYRIDVPPFGRHSLIRPSAQGAVIGHTGSGQFEEYDATGALRTLVNVELKALDVDDSDVEHIVTQRFGVDADRWMRRRAYEALVHERQYDTAPLWSDFVLAHDGSLWIRPYELEESDYTSWRRLSTADSTVRDVVLPSSEHLVAAYGDYIYTLDSTNRPGGVLQVRQLVDLLK